MKKIILVIVLLLASITHAEIADEVTYSTNFVNSSQHENDAVFIKEYTYNASDDDSRNSSRRKAITQIKSILSEEVGTYISSALEISEKSSNGVNSSFMSQEITSLSASITNLEIVEDRWDGVQYYIKAKVRINKERTMALILKAIQAKASEKDVKRLNKILEEQSKELNKNDELVKDLRLKLVKQEVENQARQRELQSSINQLNKLIEQNRIYKQEYENTKNKIEKAKLAAEEAKKRIAHKHLRPCMVKKHMTIEEMLEIAGQPDSIHGEDNDFQGDIEYTYGAIKIGAWKKTRLVFHVGIGFHECDRILQDNGVIAY